MAASIGQRLILMLILILILIFVTSHTERIVFFREDHFTRTPIYYNPSLFYQFLGKVHLQYSEWCFFRYFNLSGILRYSVSRFKANIQEEKINFQEQISLFEDKCTIEGLIE